MHTTFVFLIYTLKSSLEIGVAQPAFVLVWSAVVDPIIWDCATADWSKDSHEVTQNCPENSPKRDGFSWPCNIKARRPYRNLCRIAHCCRRPNTPAPAASARYSSAGCMFTCSHPAIRRLQHWDVLPRPQLRFRTPKRQNGQKMSKCGESGSVQPSG